VQALVEAGVKDWPPGTLKKAEQRLIQMGRHRAGQLYRVLLDADLALKGSHSHDSRARLVLEQMFLRLAKRVAPAKQASGGG
jgi:DNA polymerase-3 subunit delta